MRKGPHRLSVADPLGDSSFRFHWAAFPASFFVAARRAVPPGESSGVVGFFGTGFFAGAFFAGAFCFVDMELPSASWVAELRGER